jgi:hypothetical protein
MLEIDVVADKQSRHHTRGTKLKNTNKAPKSDGKAATMVGNELCEGNNNNCIIVKKTNGYTPSVPVVDADHYHGPRDSELRRAPRGTGRWSVLQVGRRDETRARVGVEECSAAYISSIGAGRHACKMYAPASK